MVLKGVIKQSMRFPCNTNTDYDATISVLKTCQKRDRGKDGVGEKKSYPHPQNAQD